MKGLSNIRCMHRIFANRLGALIDLNPQSLSTVNRKSWFSSCKTMRVSHENASKEMNKQQSEYLHFYETSTQTWQNETQLVDLMCDSVLFENENLIAFNKPNGLPMAISTKDQLNPALSKIPVTKQLSMHVILPAVKKKLSLGDYLTPVYSTNRLYSGVVIYSKSKEVGQNLRSYFLSTICQKINYQSFRIVTLGILEPVIGDEEILMTKAVKDQKYGSIVKSAGKRNSNVSRCHFHYSILSSNKELNCSLVQVKPVTVRNDSLHIYLNSKRSPILGDHKYGNLVGTFMKKKILLDLNRYPSGLQKIPTEIQRKLYLKPASDTYIPLHVHCESVQLPVSRHKKQLATIEAPLPKFFKETMQCLSLDGNHMYQGNDVEVLGSGIEINETTTNAE